MYPLNIKQVCLGEGRPKICVPVMGETEGAIVSQARRAAEPPAELVEFRADAFIGAKDTDRLLNVLKELGRILGEKPLIFTFRTKKEGGVSDIAFQDYAAMTEAAASCGVCDIVDVEAFMDGPVISERIHDLIGHLRQKGVYVLASNHDFKKTPEKDAIVRRLWAMDAAGADILKIAVMPASRKDTLTLLEATAEVYDAPVRKPLVTMAMGGLGLMSRLCGESFGSAMTFGAVGRTSAPGQMEAGRLKDVLDAVHHTINTIDGTIGQTE